MIYAKHDIIVLNKRLDKESRRDVFVPTQISGVTMYEYRSSSRSGDYHSEEEVYKIRIPITAKIQGNRAYVPSATYDGMNNEAAANCWTLHNDDLVIILKSPLENVNEPVIEGNEITEDQAEAVASTYGYQETLVHVTEYADNTLRGSGSTRHWRIGGA